MGAQAEAAGLVPIILGDMNMGAWEVVLRLRRRVDVRFLTPFGHSAGPDVSKPNYDFILGQGGFNARPHFPEVVKGVLRSHNQPCISMTRTYYEHSPALCQPMQVIRTWWPKRRARTRPL